MLFNVSTLMLSLRSGWKYFKGLSEFLSSVHYPSPLFSSFSLLALSISHFVSSSFLQPFFSTYFHLSVAIFSLSLSGGGSPFGTVGARAPQASLEPDHSLQTLCLRPDRTPLY